MTYDIEKIASLARLKLNTQEFETLSNDFNKIITYVQKLNEVNLDQFSAEGKIFEMTHVHADAKGSNVVSNADTKGTRSDAITSNLTHAEAMQNAPKVSGRAFETPLIVEHVDDSEALDS